MKSKENADSRTYFNRLKTHIIPSFPQYRSRRDIWMLKFHRIVGNKIVDKHSESIPAKPTPSRPTIRRAHTPRGFPKKDLPHENRRNPKTTDAPQVGAGRLRLLGGRREMASRRAAGS